MQYIWQNFHFSSYSFKIYFLLHTRTLTKFAWIQTPIISYEFKCTISSIFCWILLKTRGRMLLLCCTGDLRNRNHVFQVLNMWAWSVLCLYWHSMVDCGRKGLSFLLACCSVWPSVLKDWRKNPFQSHPSSLPLSLSVLRKRKGLKGLNGKYSGC